MKRRPAPPPEEMHDLRRRAEAQANPEIVSADAETCKLLHELQVHQIELELQNAELREARAEIEAQLERYTDLYDFAPIAYFTLDVDGAIQQANLAGANLLGCDRSQLLGRRFVSFVASHGRQVFNDFCVGVFANRRHECGDVELSASDHRRLTVHIVSSLQANGQACRLAVVDLTEQKRVEDELETARIAAEAANRAKRRFLANMSHEIRTPINAILGLAYLVQKRIGDPHASEQLNKITDSARHLLSIINDVLDLSKIEADKITLDPGDFEIEEVFETVATQFAAQAAARGLEMIFDISPAVTGTLRGDPLRLSQVLLNLVGNAVKFTESGYVWVSASATHRGDSRPGLRIDVRDTGIGIAADQQAAVFQAFEQADDSTTRRYGGTGLGLALSRSLVHLMGGEIGVDSRPGAGSQFWFTLPLAAIGATPAPVTALAGRRALVVDDHELARDTMAGLLRGLELRVDRAASGPDALAQIDRAERDSDPFDAVLIDQQMPHMTGLVTARCLKSLPLKGPLPYLVLTTVGETVPDDEAKRAGFRAVLQKPVTPKKLRAALSGLADGVRAGSSPPSASDSPDGGATSDRFQDRRLLLVEDEPVNRAVELALLRSVGFDVDTAANGAEAVSLAQRKAYDLILMDVRMQVMDGLAATRAIRCIPGRETTPILAITADAFTEDRARCLQSGMNDYLAKPVMPALLFSKLRQWLPEPAAE